MPLCVPCWRRRHPGRRLAETKVGADVSERPCCSCGTGTRSGLTEAS